MSEDPDLGINSWGRKCVRRHVNGEGESADWECESKEEIGSYQQVAPIHISWI